MTVLTAPPAAPAPASRHQHLIGEECKQDGTCETAEGSRFAPLLEEPAVALWASEAASRYGISMCESLGLLAHALLLDAEVLPDSAGLACM
jgi:hypothetical protein